MVFDGATTAIDADRAPVGSAVTVIEGVAGGGAGVAAVAPDF